MTSPSSSASQTIGRFEIIKELGRGAQSAVYQAFDPQLRRDVAIKTLYFSKSDAKRNKALLDEARAVSNLRHPSIVPVFDMGEQNGDPYLVFELVPGPNLAEYIQKEGRIPAAKAADLMRQILDALAQAHAAGIIHRDLKPSNILIDTAGTPRVMDFGIATRLDDAGSDGSAKGLTGTPAYMSPEYIEKQLVSPALDVYAAGLVLYEMVTGKRAVSGESMAQIAYQILNTQITLPADVSIDPTLSSIIGQACAKDPALRTPSIAAMKKRLDEYLGAAATPTGGSEESTEAKKQSTLDFLVRRMRHKADFPALSDSVSAINRLTSSDKESINKLSNTILKDYGLTNKIMRLVNSAYFRQSGGGNISTISRAVIVLGFDAVRNVAITVLLFEHMQDKGNARELKEAFLRANLAGMLARDASRKFLAREAEQAFVCALFHSLGELLAQYYFPEELIEIRKQMLARQCTLDQAAGYVLGISFTDLGIGIAKHWGFPADIVASLEPLPEGELRKPHTQQEILRTVASFATELCEKISASGDKGKDKIIQEIRARYSIAMPVSEKQLGEVLESAYSEVKELANVLHVNLKQSPFARQVDKWVRPTSAEAELTKKGAFGTTLNAFAAGGTVLEDADLYDSEELTSESSAEQQSEHAQSVLTAGIQDISNSLVDDFSLNDVLRIILETMYRAMGFERVVLSLRDARAGAMVARFGFGQEINTLVKQFRFPINGTPDVFQLAISKGVDIIIADIDDPKIADKIPRWYRSSQSAKTFVLFPLTIKGNPVALIYADRQKAGSIHIPEKELTLLKTLRNQAILAIKQSM
ncbi:MAG: HDOD domain-containing protein [Rhodocyclaceae bacterium]|nr:HDOD domain-containing protein [Rhodocyclaceae bacterium]MBK6907022.1 HDOD domain-containing protein [Rhodocyclaceae bacterium]